MNGIGLTEQKLKNNRDEVKKIVRSLLRANRYIINNPKGAVKILSDWGKPSPRWPKTLTTTTRRTTAAISWCRRRPWKTSSRAHAGTSSRRKISRWTISSISVWSVKFSKKWESRRVDGHAIYQPRSNSRRSVVSFWPLFLSALGADAVGADAPLTRSSSRFPAGASPPSIFTSPRSEASFAMKVSTWISCKFAATWPLRRR